MRLCLLLSFLISTLSLYSQSVLLGKVTDSNENPLSGVQVSLGTLSLTSISAEDGTYRISVPKSGNYTVLTFSPGLESFRKKIEILPGENILNIRVERLKADLGVVEVNGSSGGEIGTGKLNQVEGTSIYAGKKTEVVKMDQVSGNLATNNAREVYGKITGLNIWESDRAGLQLGIGGRGLNPNRVSNFNTRQNGYDISADALGYPESYYTPPAEALNRIEIVRGAASLQYGSQFGGFINFKMKEAPDLPLEINTRQTIGSWNFLNSYNSIGGKKGKFSWFGFFQHKQGDGWRPNSSFNNNTGFFQGCFTLADKFQISGEYTGMEYLARQPGGLTDMQFENDPRQSNRDRNWFKVNWNLFALTLDYKINQHFTFNNRTFYLDASRDALGILGFINRADPGTERDLLVDDYNNIGNESRLLWKYQAFGNPQVLLIGGRYYRGNTERKQGLASDGNDAAFSFINPDDLEHSEYVFPSNNTAIFAEHIFRLNRFLSVTPGIRWENIFTSSEGYYRERYRDLAGNIIFDRKVSDDRSNNRSFLLYGVGLSWKPVPEREFYANYSQNYRSISFNDMRVVNPNFQVDPDLMDESGFTADAGFRGQHKKLLVYELTAFYIRYNNRIGTILKLDPVLYNLYRFRTNISDSRNAGIEAMAEADIWKVIKPDAKNSLTAFGNFSFIDARYVSSEESSIDQNLVEFVPQILFRTGTSFKRGNFKTSLQWSFTSSQFTDATNSEFSASAVNGIIPAYHVLDFSISQTYKNFQFLAGVNNLLDRRYFTRRADGYPGPGIIPSDALNVYATVAYRFRVNNKGKDKDVEMK